MSENLFIHLGNSPEALAEALAASLRETSPVDPMDAIRVGIGQRGMARMVESVVAHELGISSHMEMRFPTRLLFEIGNALNRGGEFNGGETGAITWTPEMLQWAVYAELQHAQIAGPVRGDIYDPLRTWLHRAQGGLGAPSRRVLMQLAGQLARVFDAYNLDRPEWHESWIEDLYAEQLRLFAGRGPARLPDELAWQIPLWRSIHTRLEGSTPSPVQLLHNILSADDAAKAQLKKRMPALHLFGMVHIHRLQSALIQAIAAFIPVHIYSPSPTSAWWQDARILTAREQGVSPLLTKFGQHTKFLHDSLVELAEAPATRAHLEEHYKIPTADHALAHVQRAVFAPNDETLAPFEASSDDRSIAFHASHGALRQVEVLHDLILERIDQNPELEPSDFVVLCPQLARFAPLIEAVFSTTQPRIAYRIEDRSLDSANPVAQSLVKLLDIADERSSAPELLELLSLHPVRERFEIDEDELDQITEWLRRLDVRWGWNEDDRAAQGRPGATTNTWEHALRRLALGVAMGPDAAEEAPYLRGVVALPDMQGRDLVLAGKFSRFVREVFAMLHALDTTHRVEDWATLFIGDLKTPRPGEAGGLLGRLVKVSGVQSYLLSQVVQKITELQEHATAAKVLDEEIDADAFRAWLRESLAGDAKVSNTNQGAVSFARLDASRFASAKVIFLLGMDDGSFPRPAQLPSWDIRQMNPRANDHSDRNEDLYAILQALMLAEEHFAILWESLSPETSQAMPPALPVLELQRLIADHLEDGEAYIKARTTQHRMHPFSIESFIVSDHQAMNLPFTYQQQWARAALQGATGEKLSNGGVLAQPSYRRQDEAFEGELDASRFAMRLSDPQRAFLRDASKINVEPYETQLERDDAGEPNALEMLRVFEALFKLAERSRRRGEDLNLNDVSDELLTRLRGEAPTRPGQLGKATVRRLLNGPPGDVLRQAMVHLERGTPRLRRFRVGATTLFFRSNLYWHTHAGEQLGAFVLFRKLNYDALLEPWTQLCIEAAVTGKTSRIVVVVLHAHARLVTLEVSPDDAKEWLRAACDIHAQTWLRPLALTRTAARKLDEDPAKALNQLLLLLEADPNEPPHKDVSSYFGNLQTKWRQSREHGGPSEWEYAILGRQRQWTPPGIPHADAYDLELGELLYELYAPPIQALANAEEAEAEAQTAGSQEVAQ